MQWGDWEENGYHDSYFYDAAWHVEAGKAIAIQTGATAYGGGVTVEYAPWTDSELERARLWLAGKIAAMLTDAEHRAVMMPDSLNRGDLVMLTKEHKNAVKVNGEKVKGEWTRFSAGTVAEVIRADAFGTFYRKGYNKPGRHNTSAVCRLPDGSIMKAPLEKLRLARDPLSEAELIERADKLSYGMECKSLLTGHSGWWSKNIAASLMNKKHKAMIYA